MINLFRRNKVAQHPDYPSLAEVEVKRLEETAIMDRHDICDFLNGNDLMLAESCIEEIEKADFVEILEGILLHAKDLLDKRVKERVSALQRIGNFNKFENPASELAAGFNVSESRIRAIPEEALREWLIGYIELMAGAYREVRKSMVYSRRGSF